MQAATENSQNNVALAAQKEPDRIPAASDFHIFVCCLRARFDRVDKRPQVDPAVCINKVNARWRSVGMFPVLRVKATRRKESGKHNQKVNQRQKAKRYLNLAG